MTNKNLLNVFIIFRLALIYIELSSSILHVMYNVIA